MEQDALLVRYIIFLPLTRRGGKGTKESPPETGRKLRFREQLSQVGTQVLFFKLIHSIYKKSPGPSAKLLGTTTRRNQGACFTELTVRQRRQMMSEVPPNKGRGGPATKARQESPDGGALSIQHTDDRPRHGVRCALRRRALRGSQKRKGSSLRKAESSSSQVQGGRHATPA